MPFKLHKIIFFFSRKKNVYLPTLPKIFRPVTQNTLIYLFGLRKDTHVSLFNFSSKADPVSIAKFLSKIISIFDLGKSNNPYRQKYGLTWNP